MDANAKVTHGEKLYVATWANRYPAVFTLALFKMLGYFCKLQFTTAFLSTASSFYSACGYAMREKKGMKKILLITIGGGGAMLFVFLACLSSLIVTFFRKMTIWENFTPTDLEVLGTIFTHARLYGLAARCYKCIKTRNGIVTDATVALACKWYARNPCLSKEEVDRLKEKVLHLINAHPEWDATITARLWEFLGEEQMTRQARLELARQFQQSGS